MTAYLIDDRNCDVLDLLETISLKIVREHLSSGNTAKDMSLIRQECKSLLVFSTHYRLRVRMFCQDHIDFVVQEFPAILWDKELVHLMIDLLRFLDSSDYQTRDNLVFMILNARLRVIKSF
jgi:hypothetical protein